MANITIRNFPDKTKEALRVQAAQVGISLEAYVRHLLQTASNARPTVPTGILDIARKHFGSGYGVDLELPSRRSKRQTVDFT